MVVASTVNEVSYVVKWLGSEKEGQKIKIRDKVRKLKMNLKRMALVFSKIWRQGVLGYI